jgi:hypothetical protein
MEYQHQQDGCAEMATHKVTVTLSAPDAPTLEIVTLSAVIKERRMVCGVRVNAVPPWMLDMLVHYHAGCVFRAEMKSGGETVGLFENAALDSFEVNPESGTSAHVLLVIAAVQVK